MKTFLCHASEDKALVEQVYVRLSARFPDIQGWLDKYEILGGDDLIETIHAGISAADKFLIFISPNSIDKPWVRTELRKALADEISGVKPEFIIPIKVGHISQFPPFLESRFYIDIEMKTEEEWLADLYAAITRTKRELTKTTENLLVSTHVAADNPNAAMIVFKVLFWAEHIAFKITTSAEIISNVWKIAGLKGMIPISISELKREYEYAVRIHDKVIRPKDPFVIGLVFDRPGDPTKHIVSIERWDGSDGETSFNIIEFK